VDGPEFHRASEAGSALLIWEPAFLDLAASQDLGLSTGPWQYQLDEATSPVAFGHFISVWRRRADGQWRVLADIGVRCDSTDAGFGSDPVFAPPPGKSVAGDRPANPVAIEAADAALRGDGEFPGPAPLSPRVRLYRPALGPILGPDAARGRLEEEASASIVVRERTVTSQAGDFAATWGTESSGDPSSPTHSFLRVWRRATVSDPWQLALEARLPLE
jgi:hypothetical protein